MNREQIAELLEPFLESSSLSDQQLESLAVYLELLVKWNSKLNLTAIRDPNEIVTRHFGESLFAARKVFPSGDSTQTAIGTAIDVGSGAGFPGLPTKLWVPSLKITLVESNQRKATFLREVIRALKPEGMTVVTERAEKLSIKADLVTLRAVERFEHVLPIAFNLKKPAGKLAILIGASQIGAAQKLLSNAQWLAPIKVPNSSSRVLLVAES